MEVAGNQHEAVDAAPAQFRDNVLRFLRGRSGRTGQVDESIGRITCVYHVLNRQIAFVEAIAETGAANQDFGRPPRIHQFSSLHYAIAKKVACQDHDHVRFAGRFAVDQALSPSQRSQMLWVAASTPAARHSDSARKPRRRIVLLNYWLYLFFVARILRIEVADGLQQLVKTLDFSLVLGEEQAVARGSGGRFGS